MKNENQGKLIFLKNENEFKPFVPAEKVMPEFTFTSVLLGCLLAVVFGAANAYLGLRVGITVAASIPAAVISMGVLRGIMKKDSILENNMVQTIGSAGESVAAGAIFTLPALFMWMNEWGYDVGPSQIGIFLIALSGGVLGVLFMIPLRRALIVRDHGVLPYPEGTACSEVLLAGEEGGSKASTVFAGMGIGALYKLFADGLNIFPSRVYFESTVRYKGAAVGVDVMPALLGVGYICGPKVSSYIFSGGILSWLIIMPLISLFGGDTVIFPASMSIADMSATNIWENYIRYIGAAAIATAGIITLLKLAPLLLRTFARAIKGYFGYGEQQSGLRTDDDLPMRYCVVGIIVTIMVVWISPAVPVTLVGSLIIVVFGFFSAAVSSRLVGLIGSSNNPISGIGLVTLLFSALLLKVFGDTGPSGMVGAIEISSVICIIVAIAGDTSQDLKTGYILGATPRKQQIGELIGVLVSALTIGSVLYLLNAAWGGFGKVDLPAPQAMLMKMLVEGVMNGNLPWSLIFAGIWITIVVALLGIPVLPFAVGLYLPIYLSMPIMIGGLVRLWLERRRLRQEETRKTAIDNGILYTSGMIAGEGLLGVLLAICAIIPMTVDGAASTFAAFLDISDRFTLGSIGSLCFFALLILALLRSTAWKKDKIVK